MSDKISAQKLVNIMLEELRTEGICVFKAKWTFAWDRMDAIDAKVVNVNVGNGFEEAVAVLSENKTGVFLYVGPFAIENKPSKETLLLFECDNGIYIKDKLF